MPSTASAYIDPISPYCSSTSGLQSTFRPTSSSSAGSPATVGTTDEIVGRMTPSMGLTAYIEPTIMAPVEPALANPSMAPLAR